MDVSLGALVWYFLGWGVASGKSATGFLGETDFLLQDTKEYAQFFYHFVFCVTSTTICSGSLAERVFVDSYVWFVLAMTGLIYPVVAFWVWNPDGFMNAGKEFGVIDWAGSGVVHMLGGAAGLVGTMIVGPRIGRFESEVLGITGHSATLQVLGCFILWTGWYAFNCGTCFTYWHHDTDSIGGLIAVTTTLSSCAAVLSVAFITKLLNNIYSVQKCSNAALSGIVSITAGCAVITPGWAIIVGILGGCLYYISCEILVHYRVDDPLEAVCVHGVCGLWGMLAAGVFSTKEGLRAAYGDDIDERWVQRSTTDKVGVQLMGALLIIVWGFVTCATVFLAVDLSIGLRVPEEVERASLDSRHGGQGWLVVAKRVGSQRISHNVGVQITKEHKRILQARREKLDECKPNGEDNLFDISLRNHFESNCEQRDSSTSAGIGALPFDKSDRVPFEIEYPWGRE